MLMSKNVNNDVSKDSPISRCFPQVVRFSHLLKNLHLIRFDCVKFNLVSPVSVP